jgi:hypothetical protein
MVRFGSDSGLIGEIPAERPGWGREIGSVGYEAPLDPSAVNQTDDTGQRSSLAKMASADLVQTKGLELALCSAR